MGLKNWTIRLDDLRSYDEGVIPSSLIVSGSILFLFNFTFLIIVSIF